MRSVAYQVNLTTRFRGITSRTGLLLQGPAGWGEWSPFPEYERPEIDAWWAAAVESATLPWPTPVRDSVPVNSIVPAVSAEVAGRYATAGGCRTAKVKVAERGQTLADDVARVEAVRDALGPSGRVRVDANGAWSVSEALTAIRQLARFELEYVEQPCAGVDELPQLSRGSGDALSCEWADCHALGQLVEERHHVTDHGGHPVVPAGADRREHLVV